MGDYTTSAAQFSFSDRQSYQARHPVSWLYSSVTLLVSKAPLNRGVKNGCFWVDWTFAFAVQNSGGHKFCFFVFRGALILLFCFQGGYKQCCKKIRGAFFRSKIILEPSKKIQGGLHDLSENSGGPIVIPCTGQKEAPLNSQRFSLQIFSPKERQRWQKA